MHELISPDSAIDPLVTSQSGICCKTNKCLTSCGEVPQSLQMSPWFSKTPYACSPAIDGSVLIVAGRECILVYRRPAIVGGRSFSTLLLSKSLVAESTACVCRFRTFPSCLRRVLGRTVE